MSGGLTVCHIRKTCIACQAMDRAGQCSQRSQRSSTQMRWQAPASTGQTSQRLPEARILPYLEIKKSYDMFFNYRQR